jgi:zinc transporter ZupT
MSWRDHDPVWLALFGTLFTWGLTAAGSALVFVLHGNQRKVLDFSLGFAGGVRLSLVMSFKFHCYSVGDVSCILLVPPGPCH